MRIVAERALRIGAALVAFVLTALQAAGALIISDPKYMVREVMIKHVRLYV